MRVFVQSRYPSRYDAMLEALLREYKTLAPDSVGEISVELQPDTNECLPPHWCEKYYPLGAAWPARWTVTIGGF